MESNVEQVWTEVLDRASEHIDVSSLRVWFEGIRPVDLYDDRLEISVLDGGNVVRVSDKGPGISQKERAFEFGFSPGGFAADLISAIEARALWSRFGF